MTLQKIHLNLSYNFLLLLKRKFCCSIIFFPMFPLALISLNRYSALDLSAPAMLRPSLVNVPRQLCIEEAFARNVEVRPVTQTPPWLICDDAASTYCVFK